MRKIKDAKDLSTNELIYFKGHAKATYMSDGRNVEEAIRQIGTGGGGGGIAIETDPIFSASPAASITEEKKAEWDSKQAKLVSGTNIKTINGDSILGEGDLKIDGSIETYTTPFSTGELRDVKEGLESSIEANFDEITQAIKDKKLIILPTDVGVTVTSTKYNSKRKCAYLIVIDYKGVLISVKWNDGDTELPAENIEFFDIGDIDYRLGLLEEDIPTKVSQLENDAEYITQEDVAKVAISGSYKDLQDTPTIPTKTSELANDNGLVDKQTLNTALEDYTLNDGGYAVADGLRDSDDLIFYLPSTAPADTDRMLLTNGSLKAINGQSIILDDGADDISVAYPIVTTSSPAAVLQPNAVTKWEAPMSVDLSLSFAEHKVRGYAAEYIALFTVGADGVQLIVPDGVVWADGILPAMTNGKTYEISFVDNLATFLEF